MSRDSGVLTVQVKQCARCSTVKPITEYYPRKNLDGRPASYCKLCVKTVARARIIARKARVNEVGLAYVRDKISGGEPIDFHALPIVARAELLRLLDIPGRSVAAVAQRAGCSEGTVYRHRRERFVREITQL